MDFITDLYLNISKMSLILSLDYIQAKVFFKVVEAFNI